MDRKVHMSRVGSQSARILIRIIKPEDQVFPYRETFQRKRAGKCYISIRVNGKSACRAIVIKGVRSYTPRNRGQGCSHACNHEGWINH